MFICSLNITIRLLFLASVNLLNISLSIIAISCTLLQFFYKCINPFELPFPSRIIQEWTQIKPIIVWTIWFCMVRRRKRCHFVTINWVIDEKPLNFRCDLWYIIKGNVIMCSRAVMISTHAFHTSVGRSMSPHLCTNLENIENGPHFSILRSLPNIDNSS